MFHRCASLFQPGICHTTVLCIVPSEEVSDTFKIHGGKWVTTLWLWFRLFLSWINAEFAPLFFLPETLHNTPTANVFDPINACMSPIPPPDAAPCQSVAWNQSYRRRSGPSTQEWRGSTSTKGYERAAPSSKHCHNTVAGSVLASLPALLIQCAKVKFVSPHFHHSRWICENSTSSSVMRCLFLSVLLLILL